MLDQLEAGYVVTVTRLNRQARSIRDLLNTLGKLADRKARFQFAHRVQPLPDRH